MKASVAISVTAAALCLLSAAPAVAQPFLAGQGLAPLGNIRTTDPGGPYNFSLLQPQVAEVQAGSAARQNFTDADIADFLVNVECLEGLFDTWGTFGRGFNDNLELGGPTPIGARKANLTNATLPYLEEVALSEQGHAALTRALGSTQPCPLIDFDGGWNQFMAAAYRLNGTVERTYGRPFDPFLNDVNFVLSVLSLEELGATGNKGLTGILINPVHANAVAGLATSATAFAAVERFLLWNMRDMIVEPFNETAQQVFARVSALRDSLDGPQIDDQGIVNTDPRFIAVPDQFVNLIPTDNKGLTFSRTPQQVINIQTLGNPAGKGVFFPNGLNGRINSPIGYAAKVTGLEDFPANAAVAPQEPVAAVGKIPDPITPAGPATVPYEDTYTQSLTGPLAGAGPENRGLNPVPTSGPVNTQASPVPVGTPSGTDPATATPPGKQTTPANFTTSSLTTAAAAAAVSDSSAAGRKLLAA